MTTHLPFSEPPAAMDLCPLLQRPNLRQQLSHAQPFCPAPFLFCDGIAASSDLMLKLGGAQGRETTTTSSASTRLPNLTSSRPRPSNGQDPLKRGSKSGPRTDVLYPTFEATHRLVPRTRRTALPLAAPLPASEFSRWYTHDPAAASNASCCANPSTNHSNN